MDKARLTKEGKPSDSVSIGSDSSKKNSFPSGASPENGVRNGSKRSGTAVSRNRGKERLKSLQIDSLEGKTQTEIGTRNQGDFRNEDAGVTDYSIDGTCTLEPLHRIAEVRNQQGYTLRTVARKTGLDICLLKVQEQPHTNLTLKQLQAWQHALEVPIESLLVDRDLEMNDQIQARAKLVKIMKTVCSMREVTKNRRMIHLLQSLRLQLIELMPELEQVRGWNIHGPRNPTDNLGRIAIEPIAVSELSIEWD